MAGTISSQAARPAVARAQRATLLVVSLFAARLQQRRSRRWRTRRRRRWAVLDDGSKVCEQSLLENELQIAIAKGTCFAEPIVT
jgi:hypothetical protein